MIPRGRRNTLPRGIILYSSRWSRNILFSGFGRGNEEAHVVELAGFFAEEVVEGEVVQEALSGIHAVAVLVVVGGVVGIRHDDDVVLLDLGAHVVIADDDLPVAAPVVPADEDGVAGGQGLPDEIEGEHAVHVLAGVDGGVAAEAAHAVEHGDLLAQAGGAGLIALGPQLGEGLLVVIAPQAVPLQHHQRAGHAAAPLAGLLDGLEMGQDGEGVGGLHVVEVQALHAVRAVLFAEVAAVVKLHFIGVVTALLRQRGEEERGHTKHKQPYNNLFHCFHSLQK